MSLATADIWTKPCPYCRGPSEFPLGVSDFRTLDMRDSMPLAGIRRPTTLNIVFFLWGLLALFRNPSWRVLFKTTLSRHSSCRLPIWSTHTLDLPLWRRSYSPTESSALVPHKSSANILPMSQTSLHCVLKIQGPHIPFSKWFPWEKSSPSPPHGLWCKTLTTLSKVKLSFLSIFLYSSAFVLK